MLDYIRRNSKHIAHVDSIPDVRRRSSLELAERCNYYAEHAQQVVRLALAIFDQTRTVHGLTDREREWLEFAALLHDIGSLISYERHHRHSYYLIRNGDLRGFDPDEIEVVALVARYHRRGTPKRSHEEYSRLPSPLRKTVRTLASILRVAESLDRSHTQTIAGLDFRDRGADALLQIKTTGDAELEVWATNRHLQPFEALLGKPVRLEAATIPAGTAPGPADRTPKPRATPEPAALVELARERRNAPTPDCRSRNTDLTLEETSVKFPFDSVNSCSVFRCACCAIALRVGNGGRRVRRRRQRVPGGVQCRSGAHSA